MIPKYVTVQREIINYIASNGIRAGNVLPSEKELALLFGVSLITIRRAMLELHTRKIVERKHGVGTFVKADLQEAADCGQIIFLQVSKQEIPFPVVSMDSSRLQSILISRGYRLTVLGAGSKVDSRSIELLRNADGIMASGWITDEWTQLLDSLDIPTVLVGNIHGDQRNIPLVAYDWRKMAEIVAEKLIARGAKSIGILLGEKEYAPSREMVAGLRSVLAREGRELPEEAIYYTEGKASETIRKFLISSPKLDGLVLESATCVHVLASFLLTKRRPKLGVLSVSSQFEPIKNILFEAVFDGDVYVKSVEVLFSLKGQGSASSDILIQPRLC